jgi:hypothetical protein
MYCCQITANWSHTSEFSDVFLLSKALQKSFSTGCPRVGTLTWCHLPWRWISIGCAALRLFFVLLCARSSGPVAASARLPRSWHARGQVIARAELALLLLDGGVIHVHVVLHGRHVLVAQQFLETKGVVAQHQVARREGVAQDVRADALAADAGPLANAGEEHFHPVLGERGARLGQEEVILPGAAPLGQLLLSRPVPVQVVQQVARAVGAQRHAPLLGALAAHRDDPVLAVEVSQSEAAQFGDADAGVVEQPEDGAVAHGGAVGQRPGLVGRHAGHQELLELLRLDGLDERLADLGEDDLIKRVALDELAAHQPVEEGSHRAGVGLDGALGSGPAVLAGRLAHVREPGADVGGVHLCDQGQAALMVLQVVLDRAGQRWRSAAPGLGRVLSVLRLWCPGCPRAGLRVELGALRAGSRLRHVGPPGARLAAWCLG